MKTAEHSRGAQFSRTPVADLRRELSRTAARILLTDQLMRSMTGEDNAIGGRPVSSKAELARLRKQMGDLQRDLRAELRRRGAL